MDERESRQDGAAPESDWGSPGHVHALVLIAATGAGIYLCYLLTEPFFAAFAWALALAVLFTPLQRWLESKVRRPDVAAAISVVVIAVIVVVPVTLVAQRMIGEAVRGVEALKSLVETGQWRRVFDAHPLIAPVGEWIEQQFDLPGTVKAAGAWLTNAAASLVRGSIVELVTAVLIFYMLFYFLRDRVVALESFRSLSPLSRSDTNRLFAEVFDTVHATVYGTFAVAMVQGALGGLMFWWLGLPEPLLWGFAMGLLAVVPLLGAFIIWIPAALYLALEGSGGEALLLVAWGAVVVGGIDNLLYPVLVGKKLKIHSVVAFVSIVGGLIVLGPSGLILGPVIFTVTRVLLEIWSRRNSLAGV